jgi:hypothetical protein
LVEFPRPDDTTVFAGMTNDLHVRLWHALPSAEGAAIAMSPTADWRERVRSQLEWWGGVVNLLPLHKGSVEHLRIPLPVLPGEQWMSPPPARVAASSQGVSAEGTVRVSVPADVPPGLYPVIIAGGGARRTATLRVVAPVSCSLSMPNGRRTVIRLHLSNATPVAQDVRVRMDPSSTWALTGALLRTVTLGPRETRSIDYPAHFLGNRRRTQNSSVRVRMASGTYVADIERDLYVAQARFSRTPPSLDGTWRGWDLADPLYVDSSNQIGRLLLGNQPWKGKADFSARVSVMYDDRYLYVGARVTDDHRVTTWDFPAMSYPWDTDCMEVILDTRTGAAQGHDPPTPGLFRHLSLAEYRTTSFGPELWRGGGAGGPLLPRPLLFPGAETFFRPTPDGYAIICRYPLGNIPSSSIGPGAKLGFDVAFSDNDGTTYRKNQHLWAGFTQNQSWWDIGTIGVLLFGPKE